MREGHDVSRRSLKEGDIDASASKVESGVEARRRSTDDKDTFADPLAGAVVDSGVTNGPREFIGPGDLGDVGHTGQAGSHDLLRTRVSARVWWK